MGYNNFRFSIFNAAPDDSKTKQAREKQLINDPPPLQKLHVVFQLLWEGGKLHPWKEEVIQKNEFDFATGQELYTT